MENTNTVARAKFNCVSVTDFGYGKQVNLMAVGGGNAEDNTFASATPSGTLQMGITNDAVKDFFKPGVAYTLDFAPVEAAPVEAAPAEAAPAEETPAEETPAEETPAEETPAEETPAEETIDAESRINGASER